MTLSGIEVGSALVVVAHPDDAEFGAGGTIARMAAEGAEVTICVVSNGAMGSNDPDVARDALIATRERGGAGASRGGRGEGRRVPRLRGRLSGGRPRAPPRHHPRDPAAAPRRRSR